MVTREERVKEIIRAKEGKVKADAMRQGVRKIRSALGYIRRGQNELESAGVHVRLAEMTEMSDAVEKSRRSLADVVSKLIRYDK